MESDSNILYRNYILRILDPYKNTKIHSNKKNTYIKSKLSICHNLKDLIEEENQKNKLFIDYINENNEIYEILYFDSNYEKYFF
jgi:hypothetical protein